MSTNLLYEIKIVIDHENKSLISILDSEGLLWENYTNSIHYKPSITILSNKTSHRVVNECWHNIEQYGGVLIIEAKKGLSSFSDQFEEELFYPFDENNFCSLTDQEEKYGLRIRQFVLGKGKLIILPFQLNVLWNSWEYKKRYVSIGDGRSVYENMASVVKKNVRRVITGIIKKAFFTLNLPYVHKWYFPGHLRSVLCFRGDADGGPENNFKSWLNVVKDFSDATTVFFCTGRYVEKQNLIRDSHKLGLEVGSHNHWHIVFPEGITNRISIRYAEKILKKNGGSPTGFVSPAYFWNPSLYKLLEERGYLYSSSFRINHDGLPYYPVVNGEIGKVLEMPFHCLGDRFPASNVPLNSDIVFRFFEQLISKKYQSCEPMFLYCHPDIEGRMGSLPELVRYILESALAYSDVKPMHLSKYAEWWKRRNDLQVDLSYSWEEKSIKISGEKKNSHFDGSYLFRLEMPDGRSYLFDALKNMDAVLKIRNMASFKTPAEPKQDDIGEVIYRASDEKDGWFLNWKNRKTILRFSKAYYDVYNKSLNPFR